MQHKIDFITNSSSSNFIISKNNKIETVEELFILLKKFYLEYKSNAEKMIKFCKEDARFSYDEKKRVIRLKDVALEYNSRKDINDELFWNFGLNYWSDLSYEPEWIKFNSYKEYINSNNDNTLSDNNKPFIIIDMSNPDLTESEKSIIREVSYWYFPCFENNHFSEKNCKNCKRLDAEICKIISKTNVTIDTEIFKRFNSICLYSKTGYIHEYISSKIAEISKLYNIT